MLALEQLLIAVTEKCEIKSLLHLLFSVEQKGLCLLGYEVLISD